jgi:hypothetical protein
MMAHMGETRNAYKILIDNLKECTKFETYA